jgi:hypothetical protein
LAGIALWGLASGFRLWREADKGDEVVNSSVIAVALGLLLEIAGKVLEYRSELDAAIVALWTIAIMNLIVMWHATIQYPLLANEARIFEAVTYQDNTFSVDLAELDSDLDAEEYEEDDD